MLRRKTQEIKWKKTSHLFRYLESHLYRPVSNIFLGRTGFEEEKISFAGAQRILEDIAQSEVIFGNMDFHHFRPGTFGIPEDKRTVRYFNEKVTAGRALDYFSKHFKTPSISVYNYSPYFEGTHQTYHGRNEEAHYFDVTLGVVIKPKRKNKILNIRPEKLPVKVSTIEFIVRKKS